MSNLKELVGKPKAKRVLKGVHFDFKGAEITYTDMSQGGACSLENDMVLAKSKEKTKKLTPEQELILQEIGEEHTPLDKSKEDATNTPPPSQGDDGGENDEKGTDIMSEEILKELAELKRENAVIKAQKTISGFGLDAELEEGLAGALADLEGDARASVVKALTSLKETAEADLKAAVGDVKKELGTGDTDLQKALDEEAGEGGEPEAEVEKSFLDEIMGFQDTEGGK